MKKNDYEAQLIALIESCIDQEAAILTAIEVIRSSLKSIHSSPPEEAKIC